MNVIKKKIGIIFCIIMLLMIPIVSGIPSDKTLEDAEETSFGRTIIRGFVFNLRPDGFGYTFLALRIHYTQFTGTHRSTGVLIMKQCRVGLMTRNGFKMAGPIGLFTYMFGSVHRGELRYVN